MKKFSYSALIAAAVVAALLFSGAPVAEADCKPVELSPCLPAITKGTAPTGTCCAKLKEQQPCFCGYLKDPNLKQYVSSPNAKKVASTCGVSQPKC